MLDAFLTTDGLIALVTLTFLEVVLGVDNVIFISILSGKLPPDEQAKARRAGAARGDGDAHPAAHVAGLDHPADRSRSSRCSARASRAATSS